MNVLSEQLSMLQQAIPQAIAGMVVEARGLAVRVVGLAVPVGAAVRIETDGGRGPQIEGEVVGFESEKTIVMPLGSTAGIRAGDRVVAEQFGQMVNVGPSLLGRVLGGNGIPIDNGGPLLDAVRRPLNPQAIDPLDRPLIDTALATGIRSVDALVSVGRGQRLGVFAEPGVGKSILLGMMARGTAADVNVIALVGERGREVREFLHNHLSEEARAKSVVVCATGDEPAVIRLRAALVATSIAEMFRDQGRDVLLIMDSITRFCQAQRQIGLSAGEPPATKGYPPSVFATLARLLERAGRTATGSITGFYAVLAEGDAAMAGDDPISEAARGILDGHIQLSKRLSSRAHWPAVDVVNSISRVSDGVTSARHQVASSDVRRLVGAYAEVEDLLNIGAYAQGSNPDFDLAISCKPSIDALLQQGRGESSNSDFERTSRQLLALKERIDVARRQLNQTQRRTTTAPAA